MPGSPLRNGPADRGYGLCNSRRFPREDRSRMRARKGRAPPCDFPRRCRPCRGVCIPAPGADFPGSLARNFCVPLRNRVVERHPCRVRWRIAAAERLAVAGAWFLRWLAPLADARVPSLDFRTVGSPSAVPNATRRKNVFRPQHSTSTYSVPRWRRGCGPSEFQCATILLRKIQFGLVPQDAKAPPRLRPGIRLARPLISL